MSIDGGLVFDGMDKLFMPTIHVIQQWPCGKLTEDCMSISSDDKADNAMQIASGSGPRTCLSCFSLAFHIPSLHVLCAIDLSGPSGPGRAIKFGPERHCRLHYSCLSRTVASGSDAGASLERSGKESIPTISSGFRTRRTGNYLRSKAPRII